MTEQRNDPGSMGNAERVRSVVRAADLTAFIAEMPAKRRYELEESATGAGLPAVDFLKAELERGLAMLPSDGV